MEKPTTLTQLVADNKINPGDIVTGFQAVSELDTFVNHLMSGMKERFGPMNTREEGLFAEYFLDKRPPQFKTARTEEIRVIFLKPKTFSIPTKHPDKIVDDTWIEFMARVDLIQQTAQKRRACYMPCALFIRQVTRAYQQEDLQMITLVRSVIGPVNQRKFTDKLRELDKITGLSRVWLWANNGSVQLRPGSGKLIHCGRDSNN